MNSLLLYMIKFSVCIAVVYLFYYWILRRMSFFQMHRIYFLVFTVLSLIFPIINIGDWFQQEQAHTIVVLNWIPSVEILVTPSIQSFQSNWEATDRSATFSWSAWLAYAFVVGMIALFAKNLIQYLSLQKMKKRAQLLSEGDVSVYQLNENIIPFSFGKNVFINQGLYTPVELEKIIRHEFVHAKQKHSIDLLWSELLCILNWYNPFVWLMKKAIRQNLEYIADDQVLNHGIPKKEYQYLLLTVMGNKNFSIANQFNFSSLKNRIAMMNKNKTSKKHLVKFALLIPVFALVLLAFRAHSNQDKKIYTLPAQEKTEMPTPEVPVDTPKHRFLSITVKDGTAYVKNNKSEIEVYDLTNKKEMEEFTKKYGELPPPPPPAAPDAPNFVDAVTMEDLAAPPPPPVPPTPPTVGDEKLVPPPPPPAPPALSVFGSKSFYILTDEFSYDAKMDLLIFKGKTSINKIDINNTKNSEVNLDECRFKGLKESESLIVFNNEIIKLGTQDFSLNENSEKQYKLSKLNPAEAKKKYGDKVNGRPVLEIETVKN